MLYKSKYIIISALAISAFMNSSCTSTSETSTNAVTNLKSEAYIDKSGNLIVSGVNFDHTPYPQAKEESLQNNSAPSLGNSSPAFEPNAYALSETIWQNNTIFVCWENGSPAFASDMSEVRMAVEATWEAESALDFVGWGTCRENSKGIRILIADTGPHVKGLGNRIDGKQNGMVLNFTYNNWSTSCKDNETQRRLCNTSIGVHEFGHAIGFSHEQNRPDAPEDCAKLAQGTDGDLYVTAYDPDSVMNYCNAVYNNNGNLSVRDKLAVQVIYQ